MTRHEITSLLIDRYTKKRRHRGNSGINFQRETPSTNEKTTTTSTPVAATSSSSKKLSFNNLSFDTYALESFSFTASVGSINDNDCNDTSQIGNQSFNFIMSSEILINTFETFMRCPQCESKVVVSTDLKNKQGLSMLFIIKCLVCDLAKVSQEYIRREIYFRNWCCIRCNKF